MVAEGGRRSEGRSPEEVGVDAGWTFGWPVASQPAGLRFQRPLLAGGTGRLAFGIAEGKAGGQIGARAHGESEALHLVSTGIERGVEGADTRYRARYRGR